ncbi:MAG: YcxB family protein [Oscillospiraceae bacterium]|nr:YcxB family protein [Oscillospiraceae bacterium]
MEFIFKPEKLTEDLFYQISEAVAKRTEIFSRKKFPGLWEKTDALNAKNLSAPALKKRVRLRRFYGIICIALGIFLFVPGLMKPSELAVPLFVGAAAIIFGISAVIPRKTNEEKFYKKAKKLAKAINSSLKPGDTVVFNEEGIFENGGALMKYEELENVIENRSIFLVCDGKLIMVLRKTDMVIGNPEEFRNFAEEKTGKNFYSCN